MTDPRIINLAELAWRAGQRDERIAVEVKDPARHLGSPLSGLRIERLAPGNAGQQGARHDSRFVVAALATAALSAACGAMKR